MRKRATLDDSIRSLYIWVAGIVAVAAFLGSLVGAILVGLVR